MLRPLCHYDYARCKFMFQNVFDETEDKDFVDAWHNKDETSTCIIEGGIVVAFAIVSGRYLDYIVTDEEMQGQGYGSALLDHIVSLVPNLYLATAYDEDKMLVKWYESKGFYWSSLREKDAYVMVHKPNGVST